MAINKIKIGSTEHELQTTIANVTDLQASLDSKSDVGHTHNYAGSSSAGGAATSANKLGSATVGGAAKPIYLNAGTATACSSTVGSATQPVYMNGGAIAACTYTLGKSVPSNAVFTDTHYVSGSVVGNSASATSNTASALTNGNVYLNHIENGVVKNSHKISGSGATTVTSDANGNIVVSSSNTTYTLPTATSSTLGGVKVGSNITISSGTISLTKTNVTSALGYTPPTTNTTYSAATTSAAGLMSAADKAKLDGIETTISTAIASAITTTLNTSV